ncbi:hypothetical protein A4X09_0g536 [Tilletia walkeri]|uniref:Uncharacterized protein n=1 Tax=Tilletia walkeri TaxID=117179 RepID=A0A8X7T8X2_9BASI|nr:hypothetical protein A4X09_0g536 [Tilletia walkeri]
MVMSQQGSSLPRPTDGPASAKVFGIAELVKLVAEHVATQDLAAFRLINRAASIYGAPPLFTYHCYPWPKGRAFANLGKRTENLKHVRHVIVDVGVGQWDSFGDDFRKTDKRLEQWSRLFQLLEAPDLTGLETIDIKGSIRWAMQMEGLSQPSFNLNNRLATSLRSLCLTGITEAMDRHWDISLARPWWNAISDLIERCMEIQKARGEVKFRHLHLGVEGDATVMCGPPSAGFNTTFRALLLGNLESLTLGKLSYETSRALLGPLNLHPSAQISTQEQYEWPVWTSLRRLRITFGRGSDVSPSRLCDHVLDHCPVLEELHLTFGPSQPILLQTRLSDLRHLCINVPELVLGAHIRGQQERDQLESFILRQKGLISLSVNHVEVRDHTSGKFEGIVFSGLPPIDISAQSLPRLRACTGNYVTFIPTRECSVVWGAYNLPPKPFTRYPEPGAASSTEKMSEIREFLRSAFDMAKITFLSIRESSKFSLADAVEALRMMHARGECPRLTEIELEGSFGIDDSPDRSDLSRSVAATVSSISQIPTVRALRLIPTHKAAPLATAIEESRVPRQAMGFNLQYVGVGVELFDRIEVLPSPSAADDDTNHYFVGFRRRVGRHHPLHARTLSRPAPRLAAWWGEEYKLRNKPDLVSFADAFPSIMEHIEASDLEPAPNAADGVDEFRNLPVSRTLPSFRAARVG